MTILEIVPLDATTWEVFLDGVQQGQYASIASAKAAARRRIHSTSQRLEWHLYSDGHWMARARPK